jgi:hypothetical protein
MLRCRIPSIGGKGKPYSLHSYPGKNLSAGIAESTRKSGPIHALKTLPRRNRDQEIYTHMQSDFANSFLRPVGI